MTTNFKTPKQKEHEQKLGKTWWTRMETDPEFRKQEYERVARGECPCHEYGIDGTTNHGVMSGKKFTNTFLRLFGTTDTFNVCDNHYLNYKQNPEVFTETETETVNANQ